jgi:hypothetical protein
VAESVERGNLRDRALDAHAYASVPTRRGFPSVSQRSCPKPFDRREWREGRCTANTRGAALLPSIRAAGVLAGASARSDFPQSLCRHGSRLRRQSFQPCSCRGARCLRHGGRRSPSACRRCRSRSPHRRASSARRRRCPAGRSRPARGPALDRDRRNAVSSGPRDCPCQLALRLPACGAASDSATRAIQAVPGTIFAPRRKTAASGTIVCASIGSAIAEIARLGYPEATSSDSARASETWPFISDTVACHDVDR